MWVCKPTEDDEHFLHTQWIEMLRVFGVEAIDSSAVGTTPVVVFSPLDGIHVQGVTPLDMFVHPTEPVVYYFGHSHRHMSNEEIAGFDVIDKVYIPAPFGTALFSNQATAIALWDRRMKLG